MLKNVLFVIAARSGSKSIPNKNIKQLNGIPLLAYRIKQALEISVPENVWLSTDSDEYAKIGIQYGAKVPYLRPQHLSKDTSSSNEVILSIIEYCESINLEFDQIALLEPTSPFVLSKELKQAIEILESESEADAIVATKEVHTNTVFIQNDAKYLTDFYYSLCNSKGMRRQDFSKQITPSGGFYISKWEKFKNQKSFYTPKTLSYILTDEMALEIDNPVDFKWAEFLINNKQI
jgi:CMP-N,N'-diacetyllegionaminic acid synthase